MIWGTLGKWSQLVHAEGLGTTENTGDGGGGRCVAAQSSELQWERKMHHSCSFSTGLRVGLLKLAFIWMVHVQQHLLGSGCDSLSCALLSYTVPRHRAQAAIGKGIPHSPCNPFFWRWLWVELVGPGSHYSKVFLYIFSSCDQWESFQSVPAAI